MTCQVPLLFTIPRSMKGHLFGKAAFTSPTDCFEKMPTFYAPSRHGLLIANGKFVYHPLDIAAASHHINDLVVFHLIEYGS